IFLLVINLSEGLADDGTILLLLVDMYDKRIEVRRAQQHGFERFERTGPLIAARSPGNDGAASRLDRFGSFLQARVGVGEADVVNGERAVADAAIRLRSFMQRDQLLEDRKSVV